MIQEQNNLTDVSTFALYDHLNHYFAKQTKGKGVRDGTQLSIDENTLDYILLKKTKVEPNALVKVKSELVHNDYLRESEPETYQLTAKGIKEYKYIMANIPEIKIYKGSKASLN
jgi:hypothetical protein